MSVLVLSTNPANPELDNDLVNQVKSDIGGQLNWLQQDVACELIQIKAKDGLETAQTAFANHAVDVNLVEDQKRRKRLLIADMDSTMINEECIDELGDALGIKAEIAEITARAMRGELDFEAALNARVKLLKGLPLDRIKEVRREQISYAPGGRVLVQTMRAYGAYTALVSGGFTLFADYFAKRIGFDEATANILEFEDDILTGTVARPIVGQDTKLEKLHGLAKAHKLDLSQTMAVGDGANDLKMIKAAGMGVAIHAKPVVAAEAQYCFNHSDLTGLLFLQGFADEDFIR
ncbi:phosphoserine phosphatase SerB [Maritalea mediterranea]|uniref:Phosphoserine phosphatase n=1 Tax=Maritalea mediterranea TaxID=2909667 RepID=A0ABS9E7N2_9HYPH|nr:phosphoserine phosphatase SerB [Maritalea mediterranea]MCF4098892.1 phosphoserine phosphatase SerB [Maritalea mediterranea]